MVCQACGKHPATTHIKTIVNGKLTEIHLCSECASAKGYGGYPSLFGDWNLNLGSMLGGLLGGGFPQEEVQRCKTCGSSFEEISKTGKIGCADCYRTFRDRLVPSIKRIHGTVQHKGKVPGGSALRITETQKQMMPVEETPLVQKKRLLKKAIEEQDFENAAVLRDEIKELEK